MDKKCQDYDFVLSQLEDINKRRRSSSTTQSTYNTQATTTTSNMKTEEGGRMHCQSFVMELKDILESTQLWDVENTHEDQFVTGKILYTLQ